MSQGSQSSGTENRGVSPEATLGADLWGIRVPTGPPHVAERRPPHSVEEANRLVQLLLAEPSVAGRLHSVARSDITSGGSGATMLSADWDGPVEAAHADLATLSAVGRFPAIVKLGAGEREVHWATQLARHAPDLVPSIYAAGFTLGGEPVPWLVMERCPVRSSDAWLKAPWKHHMFSALLDAGVRFHLAARRFAPRVGPANVGVEWQSGLVRRALACDPPAPGPWELAEQLVERQARDWEWVLSVCQVELGHGDLYPGKAVWRAEPSGPEARALLVDYTPYPMPWAMEAAYCAAIYWGGGTGHPAFATTTHEMASLRAAYGLEVPDAADLDRLAALCVAWQALQLWPTRRHHHRQPAYHAAVARSIRDAALM